MPAILSPPVSGYRSSADTPGQSGCFLWIAAASLLLLAGISISGCQGIPVPAPQNQRNAYALEAPRTTWLGQLFEPRARDHPGESGFHLVSSGREAFLFTYALASRAEKTLDVQYYIWRNDPTGRFLLGALVRAADRGVRVRMLLDDMEAPADDFDLSTLSMHPNIEVRLFNPFAGREVRLDDFLFDFSRITHRMHNKAMIADNVLAITGGRNIGDQYATASEEKANYRDLDLLAAGPVVREVSESFDNFWNSGWSISASSLLKREPRQDDLRDLVLALKRIADHPNLHPFAAEVDMQALVQKIEALPAQLIWGKARVIADEPRKARTDRSRVLTVGLDKIASSMSEEVLLEVAYLIPGERGTAFLCGLVAQGTRVRILTNSLASNDSIFAASGYRDYREPLLRCGVELYEMRIDPAFLEEKWTWLPNDARASLHTKAGIFDGQQVFIGTYNLDPRSTYLNTELAILVDSAELAKLVTAFIEDGLAPENSYRLVLSDDGDIAWLASDDSGRPVLLRKEPDIGFWRFLITNILTILPIEEQL